MTSDIRNSIDLAFPRDAGDQDGSPAWMNSSMVFAENTVSLSSSRARMAVANSASFVHTE
jgi:hypothetical protein